MKIDRGWSGVVGAAVLAAAWCGGVSGQEGDAVGAAGGGTAWAQEALGRHRGALVHLLIRREVTQTGPQGRPMAQRQEFWVNGVVVGEDGLIVTMGHVSFGDARIVAATVHREDGAEAPVEFLGKPTDLNVAFFRAREGSGPWVPVEFGEVPELSVGEEVAVLGTLLIPTAQFPRVAMPTRVAARLEGPRPAFLLEATLYAPNQEAALGSLVCRRDGTPVGMLGMELSEQQGGALYTRNGVAQVFDAGLLARAVSDPPTASAGGGPASPGPQVSTGWIGIYAQRLDEDLATLWGMTGRSGIVVQGVVPEGPAAKGGLQAGDVIVSWDGAPLGGNVRTWQTEFMGRIHATPVGTRVALRVARGGQEIDAQVEVGPAPRERAEQHADRQFGVRVQEIPDASRASMNLPQDEGGVAVVAVSAGGWFQRGGVGPGQILVEMDGVRIRDLAHFREMLDAFRGTRPARIVCLLRGGAAYTQTSYTTILPTWEAG